MADIHVNGLIVECRVGVTHPERCAPQKVRIDGHFTIEESASVTDRVEDTVDYAAICDVIASAASRGEWATLERLARVLSDLLHQNFEPIQSVKLTLLKLAPPVEHVVDSLGVTLFSNR